MMNVHCLVYTGTIGGLTISKNRPLTCGWQMKKQSPYTIGKFFLPKWVQANINNEIFAIADVSVSIRTDIINFLFAKLYFLVMEYP